MLTLNDAMVIYLHLQDNPDAIAWNRPLWETVTGILDAHAQQAIARHTKATQNGIELVVIDPLSKFLHNTDVPASSTQSELLNALCEAHRQVDSLMAQILMLDDSYRPSKSPLWPETVKRAELIRKYGGQL